ncbi:MAG: adenylate/guanylate cyclase domain-containing protein [Mycobacteriales bacterium]
MSNAAQRIGEADRAARAVSVVRRLRRALPGDPGFGDPLSAAGRDSAGTVARIADRLFDEQPRASREVGLGVLQVWQAFAERSGRGVGDAEVTILFTDLVGFSSWALKAGDDAALTLLRAVAKALEPPVLQHRGKVVKRLGDGLMATFPASQLGFDAVQEARVRLADVEVAGHRPVLRAALHTGRPRLMGGDYLGVDVNIAARLCEKAGSDEVLASDTALAGLDPELVQSRRKKTFAWTSVKGVPSDLVVYAVTPR